MKKKEKLNGSIIEFKPFEGPKLMIDSKWEWQRREFQQKKQRKKRKIWRRTWTAEIKTFKYNSEYI